MLTIVTNRLTSLRSYNISLTRIDVFVLNSIVLVRNFLKLNKMIVMFYFFKVIDSVYWINMSLTFNKSDTYDFN